MIHNSAGKPKNIKHVQWLRKQRLLTFVCLDSRCPRTSTQLLLLNCLNRCFVVVFSSSIKEERTFFYIHTNILFFFFCGPSTSFRVMASPYGASRSHSVGLLWTSDQPDAESCLQKHSQETNIYDPGGILPTIPASERPQTHSSDRAATWTGHPSMPVINSRSIQDHMLESVIR